MYKNLFALLVIASLTACASVPMVSDDQSKRAKQFEQPQEGKAGLYIYRSGSFGGGLKKNIWVNDQCIGESAPNIFFYEEVTGGEEHKISTESEFSPNDLLLNTKSGVNYFVKQYIKMGVFVAGANLKLVDESEGKAEITKLKMAEKGSCGKRGKPSNY